MALSPKTLLRHPRTRAANARGAVGGGLATRLRFAAVLAVLAVAWSSPALAQEVTVSITSTPANGDTYLAGETITTRMTIPRLAGGTITDARMKLEIGSVERLAATTSTYMALLTAVDFAYTVTIDDTDTDGITIKANSITGSNWLAINPIRNIGRNHAALRNQANHKVDGSRFAAGATGVTGVALNTPVLGGTFERGEVIEVTVTFNAAVDVTGTPRVGLRIGSNTRQANYVSGTGTTALTFRYTVVTADVDSNGLSIGAGALGLNSGTIRTAGTMTNTLLGLGSHAISDSANHQVNGGTLTPTAVSGVSITSTPASGDGYYRLGELIWVRVTFNRAINVVTSGGSPSLALTIGTQTRQSNQFSEVPSLGYLVFGYTVAAGDFDDDGISVAAGALSLNGGQINDARSATTPATLGLGTHAITDDAAHKVAAPPRVLSLSVNQPANFAGASGTFERGERIEGRVFFNRAVDVTGTPQLALDIGGVERQADYVSGSGLRLLVFRYAVQGAGSGGAGTGGVDADTDGISIAAGALTLNGGTIRSAAADRTDADQGLAGRGAFSNDSSRLVNGALFTAAAASRPTIVSSPASSDTYGMAERIEAQIRFTHRVDVTGGTPHLALNIGGVQRPAVYVSGSGTTALRFHYIVQGAGSGGAGSDGVDADINGINIDANPVSLQLNDAAINDARDATAAATLSFSTLTAQASHKVDGGPSFLNAPSVVGATVESAPPAGGSYGVGDEIQVRVSFDRAVRVMGTPQLALQIGDATRQASYVSGTETLDLLFSYRVQVGDVDADGISTIVEDPAATPPTYALTLNGGMIEIFGAIAGEIPGTRPIAMLGLGTNALVNIGGGVAGILPEQPIVDTGDNRAPVALGEDFVAVLEAGESAQFELSRVFRDPDGDELTYSTSSSNEAVVWSGIEGGTVLLGGGRSGVATVVLFATDPSGLSARADVHVDVWEPACGEAPRPEGTVVVWQRTPPRFGNVAAEAAEGETAVVVAALREPAPTETIVRWRTTSDNDPATSDADAGDYESAFGEVAIKHGQRCAEIEIETIDDTDAEPSREWFAVALELGRPGAGQLVRQSVSVAILEGVCDRTPAVRDALVDATDMESCEQPATADLARVRELNLEGLGMERLALGDFGELSSLRTLELADNALTEISPDVLAPLGRLRDLILANNALVELPADAFGDLPGLHVLRLDGNELQALPDGLLAGLFNLRLLWLDGNPGAPFPLAIAFERTNAERWAPPPARLRVVVPSGAPFDLPLTLSIEGGTFSGGVTTAETVVSAGETAGAALGATSESGFARVSLSAAPPFPSRLCLGEPCWRGFELTVGEPLALFARPPRALVTPEPAPLFGESLELALDSLAAPGEAGESLSWSASSSDPSVATVAIADGQLLVEPEPGAEGTVIVEATATDANGQTVTVRFAVVVEFYWPSDSSRGWRSALMSN